MTNVFHIQCLVWPLQNSALFFSGAEKTGLVPHRSQKTSPALLTCFAGTVLAKPKIAIVFAFVEQSV